MTTDAPHPEGVPPTGTPAPPPDDRVDHEVDDEVDDSVRPVQHDSKNPPRWLPRALAMVVVAVFVATFLSYAFGQLGGLAVNVLISFFVALALEPIVVWLVRHGWRRGAAAGVSLGGAIVVVLGVFALFGNLFVQQLIQLVASLPDLYTSIQQGIEARWDVTVPDSDDLVAQALDQWGQDVATGALSIGASIVGVLFAITTILLITYYVMAAGPKFRAAICAWLRPDRQQEVLTLWEITQVKVSDFISSRVVLAALSSVFTFVFLLIVQTPYALPLAVFTGVVSQFVPTIGTYIGGALPVAVALAAQGLPQAIAVLVFIVAYQQVENLIFSPKVSARALEMNPAVSFVGVLGFGAVFGALGAFLALPILATVQALGNTYLQRHELVDSTLLHDPDEPSGRGEGVWSSRRRRNLEAGERAAREAEARRRDGAEE
ncbi:AI-2E family transporter [Isoptericola sp. NPDC056605]|uniref:AI-2E family transporter n=1 Tax=Isoptericola sp. NPDC056605 TaxID=3345876 RepID=UPI00369AC986